MCRTQSSAKVIVYHFYVVIFLPKVKGLSESSSFITDYVGSTGEGTVFTRV